MEAALIGTGYWGSKVTKYVDEFFHLKYSADSKFDLETIWSDEAVKAVIIATPIGSHYELCKTALVRGKHVFVEKPITLKYEEALELTELAEGKGLKLGVDYVQTFSPAIKLIQEWVNDASPIKHIEMGTKHLGRFMGSDVYKLLASHQLSLLAMFYSYEALEGMEFDVRNSLFQEADGKTYVTHGSLSFDTGRIEVSLNFPGKEMYMYLYGDNWTVKYTPLATHSVEIVQYNVMPMALPDELTETTQRYTFDENNNLRYAIKYFRDLIDGKEESNAHTAAWITQVLQQLENIN